MTQHVGPKEIHHVVPIGIDSLVFSYPNVMNPLSVSYNCTPLRKLCVLTSRRGSYVRGSIQAHRLAAYWIATTIDTPRSHVFFWTYEPVSALSLRTQYGGFPIFLLDIRVSPPKKAPEYEKVMLESATVRASGKTL